MKPGTTFSKNWLSFPVHLGGPLVKEVGRPITSGLSGLGPRHGTSFVQLNYTELRPPIDDLATERLPTVESK